MHCIHFLITLPILYPFLGYFALYHFLVTLHCTHFLITLHCTCFLVTLHCTCFLVTSHCTHFLATVCSTCFLVTLHCTYSLVTPHYTQCLVTLHCTHFLVALHCTYSLVTSHICPGMTKRRSWTAPECPPSVTGCQPETSVMCWSSPVYQPWGREKNEHTWKLLCSLSQVLNCHTEWQPSLPLQMFFFLYLVTWCSVILRAVMQRCGQNAHGTHKCNIYTKWFCPQILCKYCNECDPWHYIYRTMSYWLILRLWLFILCCTVLPCFTFID